MNWKTKAFIQRAVAALPEPLSGNLYYRLQQAVGSFNTTPEHHLSRANILLQAILKTGRPLAGSVIEVGTGRTLNIPLKFPRFRGHPNICVPGVHHGQKAPTLHA